MSAVRPPRLYVIADCDVLGSERLPSAVGEMAACGVEWIQIRAKRLSGASFYRLVEGTLRRLEGSRAVLWIDDRADLAALFPVAGVHVGQHDLPPAAVRRIVAEESWIGLSTHDLQQVRAADADRNVDVVAFGPVYPTVSKERPDPVVGLGGLREARGATDKPLVAIGGIDVERVGEVLSAGADAAVVLGAACRGNIERDCRRLLAAAGSRRT